MTLLSPRTVGMVGSACAPVAEGTVPLLHLLVRGRIVLLHCERPSRFLKYCARGQKHLNCLSV